MFHSRVNIIPKLTPTKKETLTRLRNKVCETFFQSFASANTYNIRVLSTFIYWYNPYSTSGRPECAKTKKYGEKRNGQD